jgi:hypothetical protein
MSSLRSTIESLASEFAANVLAALRGASLDELADVAGRGAPRRGPGRPRSDAGESLAAAAPKRRGRGGRLGRRSAGDISKMIESIVDALQKNASGLRAEQIRETLGVEAKELPRPLAEAISSGRITKSGQKRATTYFASGAGGAASGGKRRGRPAGRKTAKKR